MLELKDDGELISVDESFSKSNSDIELASTSSSKYNLNIALKTLDIMYLYTNFYKLDEAILNAYRDIRTLNNYLESEISNNKKFESMFTRIYHILSDMRFRVINGEIRNLQTLHYELFIFGEKDDYLIAGFDRKRDRFVAVGGTKLYKMINFTVNKGALRKAKSIRESYETDGVLDYTIENLSKSTLFSLITGDATNSKNLDIFNNNIERARKKLCDLMRFRAESGINVLMNKRRDIDVDNITFKYRGTSSKYYCYDVEASGKINPTKEKFKRTLKEYRDKCFELLLIASRENNEKIKKFCLNFICILADAEVELESYDITDCVRQTSEYRNKIKLKIYKINKLISNYDGIKPRE